MEIHRRQRNSGRVFLGLSGVPQHRVQGGLPHQDREAAQELEAALVRLSQDATLLLRPQRRLQAHPQDRPQRCVQVRNGEEREAALLLPRHCQQDVLVRRQLRRRSQGLDYSA